MEITNKLCQALQSQSQDILNAMHLVSSNVINSVSICPVERNISILANFNVSFQSVLD